MESRKNLQYFLKIVFAEIHLKTHFSLGIDSPLKEHGDIIQFPALGRVISDRSIRDKSGGALQYRLNNPEVIGSKR